MVNNFGFEWVRDWLILDTLPNFQTRITEGLDDGRFTKEEAVGCLEAIRRFCNEKYGEKCKLENIEIDAIGDAERGKNWLKAMIILDIIPGLQMWIDADLNTGKMSKDEAESCREEVKKLEKMFLEE